ncbi:MAG: ATP-binding protein [Caldicoprobacter oshimai]|uniref:histidine kinase n=1 Tax=Caldicoprobacter faecalis TaxID=937334 RepID=A0A1I5SI64_9FIRM|nr:ATP-binding protein [Caldicoprobacter faecalis]PZN10766.1 MAG: ATP-binding protein [Caldicoprobacter oshimai]SFP70413.1 Histidine kinase-, DNA gyrase B-, and HSP90-like ATPase [Caldicoprobacter faecalis]
MEDISLYILDLVQNSIAAVATLIEVSVIEDLQNDKLILSIRDNGVGMDSQVAKKVTDPFYTTRTTRKVGLGLAFVEAAAQACEGNLQIFSQPGNGTEVRVEFKYHHIDRPPLGRIDQTMAALVACNPSIDFVYTHITPFGRLNFDSREVRQRIGDLPLDHPEVVEWIREYIREGLDEISGGGGV